MSQKHSLFIVVFFVFQNFWGQQQQQEDFILSFGSCNKQTLENVLWKEIAKNKPAVWVWGGDVVYADTDDMAKLEKDYQQQWQQKDYKEFANSVTVLGTWDDHDYGLNDGGEEFSVKKESQQLFLDFIKVPKEDPRRKREGVYHSQVFTTPKGNVKVIVLDTRYFRTSLTKAVNSSKRYQPNSYGKGTVLGEKQWAWLQEELTNSKADFNLIISSVQLLSYHHGFESWGNFPHEVDKFKELIKNSNAKGIIVLSGDRHISEFSLTPIEGMSYPLVDFTSSGLTHVYSSYSGEYNPYRLGTVVSEISFGLLKFDFDQKKVRFQIRGKNNVLLQEYTQVYN
ncbi:hypothetical protein GCM10011416_17610 [Polaribacter pacificus]|uniref:PhoD-like phosphatase metallophosphatase domain-containing protein n=1 Tax=Polaribacter pacificus TaxID=1775173 RepID=A0A917I0K9_9FLAO|nr:alkaline phosphatase D family protein [Polaribacter pacificus]GGG99687.1 hypothetical protein GCM10011416_17610 [Polaribacter pacificus]